MRVAASEVTDLGQRVLTARGVDPTHAATQIDLLVEGAPVIAVTDPNLDQEDQYGRLLAYVWSPIELVNLALVTRGAAAPYFYKGARGAFSERLEAEALAARSARLGLWGACPGTPYAPTKGVATGPAN